MTSLSHRLAPDKLRLGVLAGLVLCSAGMTWGQSAPARHIVQPKATADHAQFATHSLVLPDGALLAYYVKPGRGPTLVMVPETHGDRTQFYDPGFLRNLPTELPLVVIETRGQGRSWPPPTPAQASIEHYAGDVLAVVQHLGLSCWYVAGHSLGGMIALEIAGLRPFGLRGVIALEGWTQHTVQRVAFPPASNPTASEQAEGRRQREERYRTQRWSPEEVVALTRMWTAWKSGEKILRETAYPVLSVWGDRGRHVRPTREQLLLTSNPAVELHWIQGADHYITDPPFAAEVATVITRFISRVEEAAAVTRGPSTLTNFVVIMADDLGYGDLGCYGGKARTPRLDQIAQEGLRFTDFHSNGAVCSPTRAAFLTGRYQQRSGILTALGEGAAGLPQREKTVATYLQERGYATGLFGKWHLGYHPDNSPLHHGFDEFRGHLHGALDYVSKVDQYGRVDWWHNHRPVPDESTYATDLTTRDAVNFIQANRTKPFFAFVSYSAIHFPWQAPGEPAHRQPGVRYPEVSGAFSKLGRHTGDVSATVINMIESLDRGVGEIVDTLRSLALEQRTLVLFTSDNGGILTYRGGHTGISSNGPLRGAKASLYEGGHRVPGIAWWPGRIQPGTTDALAMTMDLMPTFLELSGIGLPPPETARGLDGVSLMSLLLEQKSPGVRNLFWRQSETGPVAVRSGSWKLIVSPDGASELYDLSSDLGETRNLASTEGSRVATLQASLRHWEHGLKPARPAD